MDYDGISYFGKPVIYENKYTLADHKNTFNSIMAEYLNNQIKKGNWETNLPIFKEKENIINKLSKNKILICIAETGSGKTT